MGRPLRPSENPGHVPSCTKGGEGPAAVGFPSSPPSRDACSEDDVVKIPELRCSLPRKPCRGATAEGSASIPHSSRITGSIVLSNLKPWAGQVPCDKRRLGHMGDWDRSFRRRRFRRLVILPHMLQEFRKERRGCSSSMTLKLPCLQACLLGQGLSA